MTSEARQVHYLAMHRFGFGPLGDDTSAPESGPRELLLAELDRHKNALISAPELPSSAEALRIHAAANATRKRRFSSQNKDSGGNEANGVTASRPTTTELRLGQIHRREVETRFLAAANADIGFVERLVWFWSNHFCVSTKKGRRVYASCGAFEREAIRPHVLGYFEDMLVAVESHPSMLYFLDNVRSIGPNSRVGLRGQKNINENLAREILELHTLGVRTVYSQVDVINLAKVLTGWTVATPNRENGGEFRFNPDFHEPGPKRVIGTLYQNDGIDQGHAVLRDLARHPSTANHIATKLAIHFIDDSPPAPLIEKLAKSFRDSGGNLKEVAKALVTSQESWDSKRVKFKRPGEWLIGAIRASGRRKSIDPLLLDRITRDLGEPVWAPPSPKGYSDYNAAWLNGLAQRLDVANLVARKFESATEPRVLLDKILGPLASEETRSAIARAGDPVQAFTLLIMSPEFLWR